MQTTVKSSVTFRGMGLHTGRVVKMTILPASAEHGIWFSRTDVSGLDPLVSARWDAVIEGSQLCTRITNSDGVTVSTIEHVMAALAGCGVQNALIEINGPEVPILDGSSLPFVRSIMQRGLRRLYAPVRVIEVLKPVQVENGAAMARLSPSDVMQIDFHIDFADTSIGQQSKSLTMENGSFVRELSDSRTFCRSSDVDEMRANGLALGGTPGVNAVVFDGDQVVSPGGLRHMDEPVRHKMLDALGDLALAGAPLIGRYEGVRAGHALTNQLLRKLFATPGAARMVECSPFQLANLPGAGLAWDEIPAVA
ncbi:MAG: UDP-3-O-acyl-N-acetylglucosamine deacetylase [Pseudomonadota bacterium]